MTTPDFIDLRPPDELIRKAARGINSHANVANRSARWGARHGYEQARQLWPEPITDRPPTEADGDEHGRVQFHNEGGWGLIPWKECVAERRPWLHAPRWQPRQPSLQEQAIAAADEALQPANLSFTLQNADRLVAALSLCRRALEQAGEGK
jgi:hypothetical protein